MTTSTTKISIQRMLVRTWDALGNDRWRVVDIVLAAAAALVGLADLVYDFGSNGAVFSWGAAVIVLGASVVLAVRSANPIMALVVISVARLVIAAVADTEVALSIHGAVALYSVARNESRRNTVIAAIGSAVVAAWAVVVVSPTARAEEAITEVIIVLLFVALAEIVRTNAARTADRISAQTAERVQAERLRIARDLHDVVAHSLSNIAVQSGVASRLIETNPEHTKRALDIINDASRGSLDELRSLLGLLRSEDDLLDTGPTPDRPGDIDEVIKRSAADGVKIEIVRNGDFPPNTSPGVVLAACRIIQESLTNVSRHAGPVAVLLELDHNERELQLRVSNEPGAVDQPKAPSTGVGIIGMIERAEAIGGCLATRRLDSGGFQVEASLPYRQESLGQP